jgi:uncharacterized cupredoxin-like copper-binding protein
MKRASALVLASVVVLAACGGDDDGDAAAGGEPRTIEVSMTDNAYSPASLDVEAGETVRFVFRNDGAVRHEAVIGTGTQQEEHHADMAEMAGMEGSHEGMDMGSMDHGELHAVVVEPGETVEMMHTFESSGPMMIGCHEPGHWEAGMKMTIDV